jgi:hypothetical protein
MLNDRKFKTLEKKNSVQQNVRGGMWKCSGTISKHVLETMSDLVGNDDRKARKSWIAKK